MSRIVMKQVSLTSNARQGEIMSAIGPRTMVERNAHPSCRHGFLGPLAVLSWLRHQLG
jgi:hypothetical protein